MGCYSVHCSITGLPIYGEKAVQLNVSKGEFSDSGKQTWYPTGFPIYGEADTYGGLVDVDNRGDYLLFHEDAWKSITDIFVPEKYKDSYTINLHQIIDSVYENFGHENQCRQTDGLSERDIFYRALFNTPKHTTNNGNANYFLMHNLFFDAEQSVHCSNPDYEYASLYDRCLLADIVAEKMQLRTYNPNDDIELQRIYVLWNQYSRITGKNFVPVRSSPFCEQHASKESIKQRKKFYKFCSKLAKKIEP